MKTAMTATGWILTAVLVCGQASAGAPTDDGTKHDLAAAKVMDRTILAVLEEYYDSSRMDPRRMFRAALNAIQKQVAEVTVSWSEEVAVVSVLERQLSVPLNDVNSPWGLSRAFYRVFRFLAEALPGDPKPNYRMIEYEAVNGLLSTLDPHTSAMTPDVWNEMQMSTRGEFEGIGIRITTDYREPCNGTLTVVEVFDGTPAQQAGLRVGDQILRIDGDSTVNITTSEAADQLRGKPGTEVTVGIARRDGSKKTLKIVRRRIPIDSVRWKMLDDNIGYIELEAFQQGSADEMATALEKLHGAGMKGLILDLRNNPGGLLDAAIEIADLFISSGTLVTTAGRAKDDREVRNAEARGTEPDYPIAALIDAYTASAAEILSGALRNHGRAILVGETSFGKGSVQNIIGLPDDGALRMTIQQYLIPGDISIQAVGVSPDVYFLPTVIDREGLVISARDRELSEASLDAHLSRASEMVRADRPGAIPMKYFISAEQRRRDLDMVQRCYLDNTDDRPYRHRFELEFARRLLAAASGTTTAELLLTASDLVAEDSRVENQNVEKALTRFGVDWTTPENREEPLVAQMTPTPTLKAIVAVSGNAVGGKKLTLDVSVKNTGNTPVHRLRAKTKSDNGLLSGLEVALGRVAPGGKAKWTAVVEMPPLLANRVDPVDIEFFSHEGIVPEPARISVRTEGRVKPLLEYDWAMEDLSNGNGFMEPGERFLMRMRVRNAGPGDTFRTVANLSAGPGIDVEAGHVALGKLSRGSAAEGTFELLIPEDVKVDKATVTLVFEEWVPFRMPSLVPLQQQVISLPIHRGAAALETASGTVTVDGGRTIPVRTSPDAAARVFATAERGSSFRVDGSVGDFFRLVSGEQRGFVRMSDCVPGGKGDGAFTPVLSRPPVILFNGPQELVVSGEKVRISGHVSHPDGVRDLLLYLEDDKLAYHPLPSAVTEYDFSFEVALKPGANRVVVVARHDANTMSSNALFLRRAD